MPLDQRCNVAVLSSGQQIAFPVARDRSVFRFRWPFADRDGIDDLPPCMSMLAEMARATHAPLRPQVVHQLFFQYATRLNEQTTVDGLVRHAHALVVGIPILQPPGNLLGRPVQNQFTRNDISQLAVHGQRAALGSQSRLPSLSVRIMGTIGRTAAMAYDLSAHCRGGTTQTTGDLANRRVGSDPSRNIFSLSEGECYPRTTTRNGSDAPTWQQQLANRGMWPAISAPNLMHGLPGLPAPPNLVL